MIDPDNEESYEGDEADTDGSELEEMAAPQL